MGRGKKNIKKENAKSKILIIQRMDGVEKPWPSGLMETFFGIEQSKNESFQRVTTSRPLLRERLVPPIDFSLGLLPCSDVSATNSIEEILHPFGGKRTGRNLTLFLRSRILTRQGQTDHPSHPGPL